MKANVKINPKRLDETDIEDPYEKWEMTIESMQELFKGMLNRTVSDLTGKKIDPRDFDKALNWLVSDNYNHYYISFPLLCEGLEVEQSYLRKQIYNLPNVKKRLSDLGILEGLLKRNKRD
ncbi:hypothetical protein GOV12_02880 [Candidatus Pacearchaeota archaeon]|nr:hypothetical protein [Candidatus Pacearchaeota archaeon]